jgi:hypothetical protein
MAAIDYNEINTFLKEKNLSASQKLAIGRSLIRSASSTFGAYNSPLAQNMFKLRDDLELLALANKFYMANRNTKTHSVEELLEGGRELARQAAQASMNKEQTEANRGRPELTYPNQTNSADWGKVSQ